MNMLSIIILILLIVGIILIILSLVYKDKKTINIDDTKLVELQNALEASDKAIKNLNDLYEYIISEIEKKQKELMLLYDIMDEKEKKLNNFDLLKDNKMIVETDKKSPQTNNINIKKQVLKLYQEGYNIEEIAKELSIGKGEVNLFIQMDKRKNS